jgi:hypothetical protein
MERSRLNSLRHGLAVAAGLAAFATIFLYTGESEVMAAAFGGLGSMLFVYLAAEARGWLGGRRE